MKKKTQEQAVAEIASNLSPELSLEKFVYVNAITKSIVTCRHHGDKLMLPNKLKIGQGCGECKGVKIAALFSFTISQVLEKFKRTHGERYDYSKLEYYNNNTPVIIICRQHGEFLQAPEKHWSGKHCPKCSKESYVAHNRRSNIDTITQANIVHHNKYLYLDVRGYENCKLPREVTCVNHGIFLVTMDNHIGAKSGCAKCSGQISLAEIELKNFVESLGLVCESSFRLPSKKHIDIYIPSLNIGIEYNGLYFHGENMKKDNSYHANKYKEASGIGIRLIQVFEDEYLTKKSIVESCLRSILGKQEQFYFARKLRVVEINKTSAAEFFDKNHLRGSPGAISKTWALVNSENTILAAMSFSPKTSTEKTVELIRFSSTGRVIGGFGKLLKAATKTFNREGYTSIVSFSDNRWSEGKVYSIMGFKLSAELPPTYYWCRGIERLHKRGFQRKYLPYKLKTFNEALSESENCRANGFYKIWDAGMKKWELKI